MGKLKAKLTALFMAVGCFVTCLGIGVGLFAPKMPQASAEMTAEQLEQDFTNNGQFVVEKAVKSKGFTIIDGATEAGLPSGWSGAVLKVTDDSGSNSSDDVRINFSASNILAADVKSIVVRAYATDFVVDGDNGDQFRTLVNNVTATQKQYSSAKYNLSTWCDVVLTADSIATMTDENGYLDYIDITLRDKVSASVFYIDSVKLLMTQEDLAQSFANNVKLVNSADNSVQVGTMAVTPFNSAVSCDYVSGGSLAANNLNTFGSVLKITSTSYSTNQGAYVGIDFSESKISVLAIESISIQIYTSAGRSFRFPTKVNTDTTVSLAYIDALTKDVSSGWSERVIDCTANYADIVRYFRNADGNLGMVYMGFRASAEAYIGGVTIRYNDTALKEFTNDGQFTIGKSATADTRFVKFVDGTTIADSTGATGEGTALQINVQGGYAYVTFDFSASRIEKTSIGGLEIRAYLPGWVSADRFRVGGTGIDTDLSYWNTVTIDPSLILTDENGYITTVGAYIGFRVNNSADDKATVGYIDSVELVEAPKKQVVQVGKVEMYGAGDYSTRTDRLYLKPTDQTVAWVEVNANFYHESGTSLQIIRDGEVVYSKLIAVASRYSDKVKHFYLKLDDHKDLVLQAGDIVRYSGTYFSADHNMAYVIEESEVLWDGQSWGKVGDYITHQITELKPVSPSTTAGSNKAIYLKMKSGAALPFGEWKNPWYLESGVGLKLNGETVTINSMQSAKEGIYITFNEVAAGDVLTLSGTFKCPMQKLKYEIAESSFTWDGSVWSVYEDFEAVLNGLTEYKPTQIGGLCAKNAGVVILTAIYLYAPKEAEAFPKDVANGDWSSKYTFLEGSGDGITLSGNALSMDDIKFPGDFYVPFGRDVEEGEIFTIDGTFYNVAKGIKFTFTNFALQWNGTAWVEYVEYETKELGTLAFQKVGSAAGVTNRYVYFTSSNGAIPVYSTVENAHWNTVFAYESGAIKYNDAAISATVKVPGEFFVDLASTPQTGDKLTISGRFYNKTIAWEYIVEESTFEWNGTAWVEYIEYETKQLGTLTYHSVEGAGNIYVNFRDSEGKAIPVYSTENNFNWDTVFSYESGAIKYNDAAISAVVKFTGNMFIDLGREPQRGDKLTISGRFYYEPIAWEYIVEESTFWWTGSAWSTTQPQEMQTYDLGALKVHTHSNNGTGSCQPTDIYLTPVSVKLPIGDWGYYFTKVSGTGILVNNVESTTAQMISAVVGGEGTNGQIYIKSFGTFNKGDVLTVGGTFVCEGQYTTYVITDTSFVWTGEIWELYVNYTSYNVGTLAFVSGAEQSYFCRADGEGFVLGSDNNDVLWNTPFSMDGVAITINGKAVKPTVKVPGTMFIEFASAPVKGDLLVIGGTFYCPEFAIKYVVTESTFVWDGTAWVGLATYDEVTMEDLGLPNGLFINQEIYSGVQNVYTKSANNTTGSVVFKFGYNSTNVSAGAIDFRLRGENWRGFTYRLAHGKISVTGSSNTKSFTFANNVDYVVELGTIDLMNGTSTWVYIKINGEFVSTGTIEKTATMQESGTPYEYSTFTTNKISIYANASVVEMLLMHPDYVAVKYMTERPFVEFVEKGEAYNLSGNRTNTVLIGWVGANNNLYQVGEEVQTNATMAFSPVEIDYTMEAGASIRLADSADYSGIRFTAFINNAQLQIIAAQYGITDIEYGMLILPYDELTNGQMPNLDDYVPGETILKIPADNFEDNDGIIQFRGAMQKLYTENYGRFFAGRGYLQFTVNGEQWTIYTQFDYEDNVRSVRYVARKFQEDKAEYDKISSEKKAVVAAYIAEGTISLIDYETYATTEGVASANNPFKVMAWNFPKLDTTNGYFNAANEKIATDMKNAGIQVVILAGENLASILPNTPLGRERMHQVIRFFNSQGLQTMAFLGNATKQADTESKFNALACDFVNGNFADFADCDGFLGFLTWDEPYGRNEDESYNRNEYKATLNKIKDIVNSFEVVYANTDVLAWANLLPSYASFFDKSTFVQYLQDYCDIVLKETDGEKWLSIDTYPIMKDYSLAKSFLYDLGMLKKVALEKSATVGDEIKTHVVLQSSGWIESNDDKSRIPEEEEMRMQAYSAMAFGIDTISWFTYSPSSSSGGNTYYAPVDSNGNIAENSNYTAFSNVNKELQAISKVYSSFTTWKGVILGQGSLGTTSYSLFDYVKGTLGDYELSASNTTHLSGVANAIVGYRRYGYLMGVMEDVHGNEAYVLTDLNKYENRNAQTITLTFKSNITEVVIYRGGVAQTVSVSNKSLAVSLSVGEGVIILPSKLN